VALYSLLSGWWDPWRDIPTLAILALGGYFLYIVSSLYDRLRAMTAASPDATGPDEPDKTWDNVWEDDEDDMARNRALGAEPDDARARAVAASAGPDVNRLTR
jgi:hypothetical protein